MSAQEDEIVRTETIAREFGLKEPLAREIVSEETQRALRRSKLAWLVLLSGLAFAGWLYTAPGPGRSAGFWVLLGTVAAWLVIGRYFAGPAIRKAAAAKAARIKSLHYP